MPTALSSSALSTRSVSIFSSIRSPTHLSSSTTVRPSVHTHLSPVQQHHRPRPHPTLPVQRFHSLLPLNSLVNQNYNQLRSSHQHRHRVFVNPAHRPPYPTMSPSIPIHSSTRASIHPHPSIRNISYS